MEKKNYLIEYSELKKLYQKKNIKLCEIYETDRLFELICKLASKMENKKYFYEFYIFPNSRFQTNHYVMCLRDILMVEKYELLDILKHEYSSIDSKYVILANCSVVLRPYEGNLFGMNWSRHDIRPDFMDYVNCSINGGEDYNKNELFINITDPHFSEYICSFINYIENWKICNARFNNYCNWDDYEALIEPFIEQYKEQKKIFCKK